MAQKYIEVKGPFQIRGKEAASKIGAEVLRLAKKYPTAKFILRESVRHQGSGSAYSAAFKTLTSNKMGDRIHVVKAQFGRGRRHLGPPSQVREAKIKKLGAFHVAEFTFSGKIPSAEYKAWEQVDKSISKEKTWDPLRSKTRPASFGFSRRPKDVKKYVGGTTSATKKIDALIDRVSEYGRKQGARQGSVDTAIEYIRDKSDEFAETQRFQNPSQEPIHMLSKERLTRLDRLQKNYGTPPVQTGKVNIEGAGQKKIVPQVPIQTDPHKIYRSNIKTSSKEKFKGEAKKGLPGTGFRESGTKTSFLPVGITEEFDSAREFDDTSHMLKDSDIDKPVYPEQSSQREPMTRQQRYNVKTQKYVGQEIPKGQKPVKIPAQQSTAWYQPERKTTQFPFISETTGKNLIVNEFSKLSSGLKQWDKHKSELDSSHSITPADEFKKSDFESPDIASSDKGGGSNIETHTDEFMDRQQKGLQTDLANIEKQPWLIDSVTVGDTKKATKTTTITDVLHGDAISSDTNPKTGTKDRAPSSTSPQHVSDPIKPYRVGDPELTKKVRRELKKPVSPQRKQAERLENLRGESTHIEFKKNKMGVEYAVLKQNQDGTTPHTRAQLIKKNYIEFRNKAVKDFNVKIEAGKTTSKIEHPAVADKDHGSMKTFSLKKTPKTKVTGKSAGSIIRKGFGLAGAASILIAPVLAVREVQAANKKLTPSNIAQETVRFMLGSDKVWSGVNATKKGYFQKVGPLTKGVEGGRRPVGPIPGAGGPDTPYAQMKKSISGAMIQWSNASGKANEAMKLHGGWRFK